MARGAGSFASWSSAAGALVVVVLATAIVLRSRIPARTAESDASPSACGEAGRPSCACAETAAEEALRAGRVVDARASLNAVNCPESARRTFVLARVAEAMGNYHDAREGLLRVLTLDPSFADARYELARLTFSRGALLETQHHVEAFAATYPGDPRVAELQDMLTKPPPKRAMTLAP